MKNKLRTQLIPPEQSTAVVVAEQPSVMNLMAMTIEKFGVDGAEKAVEVLKELKAMHREQELWDAQKKFYSELSEFQKECPVIRKNKSTKGGVTNEGGSGWGYMYATLDNIEKTVRPLLIHRGFSYTWDSETTGKEIKMTIHLRHKDGFEITACAVAPIPNSLAKMNEIQIPESVRSYLKRATLSEVLGLSTAEDTDAKIPGDVITAEQVKELSELMKKCMPESGYPRFLKVMKVEKIEDIRQDLFDGAKYKLMVFRKEYAGAGNANN